MENRTFYYARVSSREQNLDRQIDAFKELGANERDVIVDKESGKNLERTGYTALKNNMLRSGDTLIVTSLDRDNTTDTETEFAIRSFNKTLIIPMNGHSTGMPTRASELVKLKVRDKRVIKSWRKGIVFFYK